jgi:glutaconate CoA-transferase, subunit B
VDFTTSAGFLGGRAQRTASGVRGGGPQAVVTDLGILEPDENGELTLTAIHPGVEVEQVRANTGWELKVAHNLRNTDPVLDEELRILREDLDPGKIYL